MARPVSWLPRLHEISRSVSNSVRSHYDRSDLERLFELQPRAALKLLEMLPTVAVGTSRLVEREALAGFLEGVKDADDTTAYFEQVRLLKVAASNRRIRSLVRRDLQPIGITSLPESIQINPGRLEVSFQSVEQLAEAMYSLARVLEAEGDEFARRFEPSEPAMDSVDAIEVGGMFADLEVRETRQRIGTRVQTVLTS